jgi:transcription factor MYB, plant
VQKHAKQLNCDANSKRFKDAMRYLWMPHLVDAGNGRLLHSAEHQQAAAIAGGGQDGYYYHTAAAAGDVVCAAALSGMGGVTSSSSDPFATTTTSDSYDAFPNKWDPAFLMRAGEILATGGNCWAQEMLTTWPAAEQKAAAHVVAGGQFDDGELSGWVQSFYEGITTAENSFWTLEDIWKTQ